MSDKAKELAEWARQFGEGWYTDDDAETEVGKRLDAIAAELTRLAEVERVQRDALEWIATFGSMLPTSVLNRARAALGAKDKGG